MNDVIGAEKENSGIRVEVDQEGARKRILFSFEELVVFQVNISHLLQNPNKYRVDVAGHRIMRKKHGS